MGSVYQRGSVWWSKIFVNGIPVRESTGKEKKKEAEQVLKVREGRAAAGLAAPPRADKIRYEEIAADLRQHYEAHPGTRDVREYDRRVKHLARHFAGRRIATIDQAPVDSYIVARRGQGAASATIRRELGTLTTMLRRAYKNRKLMHLPLLERPKESPAREGFFEQQQYDDVRRHLAEDLRVAVQIAHTFAERDPDD
jgi:hypothetical protein